MNFARYRTAVITVFLAAGVSAEAEDVTIYRPFGSGATPPMSTAVSRPPGNSGTASSSTDLEAPSWPRAIPVEGAASDNAPTPPPLPASASYRASSASFESLSHSTERTQIEYAVHKGDTLWRISKTYGISVEDLKETNHLSSNDIRIGMKLLVPGTGTSPVSEKIEVRRAQPVIHSQASVDDDQDGVLPVAYEPESAAIDLMTQAELQHRFIEETKRIALVGVGYNRDWVPPGESEPWAMDCSNTTRYLYKKVTGVTIERTASDQYYYLQQKGFAWEAPLDDAGRPDVSLLSAKLQVGDLLFWENTYRPHRDPPITHVMIYLGKNTKGDWLMAGSQGGSGFFNVAGSGPDIYRFNPIQRIGGYSKNLGLTRVTGRFIAYGRPLLGKRHSVVATL